jgi:hypothetical protein
VSGIVSYACRNDLDATEHNHGERSLFSMNKTREPREVVSEKVGVGKARGGKGRERTQTWQEGNSRKEAQKAQKIAGSKIEPS